IQAPAQSEYRWWELFWRRGGYNWTSITALWHSRGKLSKRIKGAQPRGQTSFDICHGAGATLVGAALALLLVVCIALVEGSFPHWWVWLIAIVLVVLHSLAYLRAGWTTHDYTRVILIEVLEEEKDRIRKKAYELWVARGRPADDDWSDWFEAERQLPEFA